MNEEDVRKHYQELKKNGFDVFFHTISNEKDFYEELDENQFVEFAKNNRKVDMFRLDKSGKVNHYPDLNIGYYSGE